MKANTNHKLIADRMIANLVDHADEYGADLVLGLESQFNNFFASLLAEEEQESKTDKSYEGLAVDVVKNLAIAMQRFADDFEQGNI